MRKLGYYRVDSNRFELLEDKCGTRDVFSNAQLPRNRPGEKGFSRAQIPLKRNVASAAQLLYQSTRQFGRFLFGSADIALGGGA